MQESSWIVSEWRSGVHAWVDDWQTPGLRKDQASTVREHLSRTTYFSCGFMDPPSQMPQVHPGPWCTAKATEAFRINDVNIDRCVPWLALLDKNAMGWELNNKNLFSPHSEGWKCELRMPAWLVSGENSPRPAQSSPYCVSLWSFLRTVQRRRESGFSGLIRTLILSGQGPTLRTSVSSNHFLRSPISRYTHRGL